MQAFMLFGNRIFGASNELFFNMAKVFYFPYAKYEIESNLSKDELIQRITDEITNLDLIEELTTKNKGKFTGAINKTSGKFWVRKRLNYRNNFNSTIKGTIVSTSSGSTVSIVLKLHTFHYIFLVVFCFFLIFLGISSPANSEDFMWAIGGLGFIYALTFFTFNMAVGEALDTLHELV